MVKKKKIRTKGKLQLSRYFQEFEEGDNVAVVKELSLKSNFPSRLQGRTGIVKDKKGNSYIVEINDQNKPKEFIMEPIHLKKIEFMKKNDKK